jgi:hypothetical protein
MVFLVGAQRSGTNWLQRMLSAHPDIVTLPSETQLFYDGINVLAERVQHGAVGSPSSATVYMGREEFLDATRAFCDAVFGGVADRLGPGARRVLERSPNHVERLDLIGDVYPDAWIVHIVRDGRDVARSLVSQQWGPRTVPEAAELWARSIRSARSSAGSLARYREVQYETLLADPATGLKALFEFLDVDASERPVEQALHEAGIAFNTDVRRPAIGDGKWRTEWNAAQLAEFTEVAGDVLTELGYEHLDASPARSGVRRVSRLARRRPEATPTGPRRPVLPMEIRQRSVDALCAALAARDADAVVAALAPTASVRVVSAGADHEARADDGRDLVAKALAADPEPWGTQLRGDVHVSATLFVVVLTHQLAGGQARDRLVLVRFSDDGAISELALYGFPL